MIGNRDFALLYAGRAVFSRNGGSAGVAVGRNGMHGNVQAACIRGKNGGMRPVSMGDGLENVSSEI